MRESEYELVQTFARTVSDRIKRANDAINAMNFGVAREILLEPLPELNIGVDLGAPEGDFTSEIVVRVEDMAVVSITEPRKKGRKTKITTLVFPYDTPAFHLAWNRLLSKKKWATKSMDTLQKRLDELGRYEEEFAIMLMDDSYDNNWQGVVFDTTPERYRRWQASRNSLQTLSQPSKASKVSANIDETQRAFAHIDAAFGITHDTDEQ